MNHLGVERLPGSHRVAQAGERPQVRALGDRAVLGGGHTEDVHALALDHRQPIGGVEAGVVKQRGGAA